MAEAKKLAEEAIGVELKDRTSEVEELEAKLQEGKRQRAGAAQAGTSSSKRKQRSWN